MIDDIQDWKKSFIKQIIILASDVIWKKPNRVGQTSDPRKFTVLYYAQF